MRGYPPRLYLCHFRKTYGSRKACGSRTTPRQKCILHKSDYPPNRDHNEKGNESPDHEPLSLFYGLCISAGAEDKLGQTPKECRESQTDQYGNERINKASHRFDQSFDISHIMFIIRVNKSRRTAY